MQIAGKGLTGMPIEGMPAFNSSMSIVNYDKCPQCLVRLQQDLNLLLVWRELVCELFRYGRFPFRGFVTLRLN